MLWIPGPDHPNWLLILSPCSSPSSPSTSVQTWSHRWPRDCLQSMKPSSSNDQLSTIYLEDWESISAFFEAPQETQTPFSVTRVRLILRERAVGGLKGVQWLLSRSVRCPLMIIYEGLVLRSNLQFTGPSTFYYSLSPGMPHNTTLTLSALSHTHKCWRRHLKSAIHIRHSL